MRKLLLAESVLSHLYFFGDLSYHLKRIGRSKGIPGEQTSSVLREVCHLLLEASKAVDHRTTNFNLFNWGHARAQLADELNTHGAYNDIIVSPGCNGEYALADLNASYESSFGTSLCGRAISVRLAHWYDKNSAADPRRATESFEAIRNTLTNSGYLEKLEGM